MRIFMSAVIWDAFLKQGMTQAELPSLAQKLGCQGVEFRPYWQNAQEEAADIRQQLTVAGLSCTYACNDGLLADTKQNTLAGHEKLVESIALAVKLGASVVRMNTAAGPFDAELIQTDWWKLSMRRMLDLAERHDVTLAVENAPDRQKGSLGLLRSLFQAAPELMLTFDTGNWRISGQDEWAAFNEMVSRIGCVHLKNILSPEEGYAHSPLYQGIVQVRQLAEEIEKTGYLGNMILEFPGGAAPEESVKRSLAYLGR